MKGTFSKNNNNNKKKIHNNNIDNTNNNKKKTPGRLPGPGGTEVSHLQRFRMCSFSFQYFSNHPLFQQIQIQIQNDNNDKKNTLGGGVPAGRL